MLRYYVRVSTTTPPSPPPKQRKDAQRNHEAILAAARELLSDCAEVPMCEIARQAGVGQATLYRHFPDRRDLAVALLEEQLERIEALAAELGDDPDAFFILVRRVVEWTARFHPLADLARSDARLGAGTDERKRRYTELMRGPLGAAKAAGTVRCDVTTEDVFLVMLMVRGAMEGADGAAARTAAAGRALALAMGGLTAAQA
jgi:AcrR family transcriptional regulator